MLRRIVGIGGSRPGNHLTTLVVRGSMWTIAGYGGASVLRLASNLVLSRLLAPQAFGLMGLVFVCLQALEMFSDLGIMPSLVRSRRSHEEAFVNTAWTVQVVRGFGLWMIACVIAWPAARIYDQPGLVWLLPAAGLSAIIAGFNSTSVAMLNRNLSLGWQTLLTLGTQFVSAAVTIGYALVYPTVWALVAGALAGAAFKMAAGHTLLPGIRNRLRWEPAAVGELVKFGKWIFVSTVLAFFAARADRLILGRAMTISEFGLFSMALFLATYPGDLLSRLADTVLFPAFSRLARSDLDMRRQFSLAKLAQCAIVLPVLVGLVVLGPKLVDLLYDPRYHDAGWMVRCLAASEIGFAITGQVRPALLARGDSGSLTAIVGARAGFKIAGMAIGGAIAGSTGMVYALVGTSVASYPVAAWASRRRGLWLPLQDLLVTLACVGAIAGGLGLLYLVEGHV